MTTNARRSVSGKVARLVSDREVILNRGSNDGVEAGATFYIFDAKPVSVSDPDTGEDLGDVRAIKAVVRAIEVAPRLTLARTFRTRPVNIGGSGLAGIFASPEYVQRVETLPLDPSGPRSLAADASPVLEGDAFEEAVPAMVDDIPSVALGQRLALSTPADPDEPTTTPQTNVARRGPSARPRSSGRRDPGSGSTGADATVRSGRAPSTVALSDDVARALDPSATFADLLGFCVHPDPAVRAAVASRADSPLGALLALGHDRNIEVLAALVRNPRASETLIRQLAEHRNPDIRDAALMRLKRSMR